jgi:cyclophilin family peptidyl-prolyl cis-trans isomerase
MSVCSLYSTHQEQNRNIQGRNVQQCGFEYSAAHSSSSSSSDQGPVRVYLDFHFIHSKIRCLAVDAEKEPADVKRAIAMNKRFQTLSQAEQGAEGVTHRVVFELDAEHCPRTTNNFVRLVTDGGLAQVLTGEREWKTATRIKERATLHGTYLHKLIPGFIVAGGDISGSSGLVNSKSALCRGGQFPDECLSMPHDSEGLLAMVNNGVGCTNGSMFFVTLANDARDKLDARHTVFGRAVSGFAAFRKELESVLISGASVIASTVVVADCGLC